MNLIRWILLTLLIALLAGSASAIFLVSLDWVTEYRNKQLWLVLLLPFFGFIVGAFYHYNGQGVEKGNKLILENIQEPVGIIPLKMAPLIMITTLITHLGGGSAGREGTAVQMSGALSDQFSKWFKLSKDERRILLMAAIAAGFSSVFGTPLAGFVFAFEVSAVALTFDFVRKHHHDKNRFFYTSLLPIFSVSLLADIVTQKLWKVGHTHYEIGTVPGSSLEALAYLAIAGICFGWTALGFIKAHHFFSELFKKYFSFPPFRPFVGGGILVVIFFLIFSYLGHTDYMGLGIPVIEQSFKAKSEPYDFIFKLLLTAFTLGCGFKGGEVTPLFFIGATLGSALALILPLPTALLAGAGFVAVFAGAAKAPLACFIMSIELFGTGCAPFTALACLVAYFCSGKKGIYS